MSLTGVIYGGIVVLWLCYLVPLALRRYDDASRARSVERFSTAMRVLGRAEDADRRPLAPSRTLGARSGRDGTAVPVGASSTRTTTRRRPAGSTRARTADARVARAAARKAAARRRRVLFVLLLLVAATAGVCAFGFAPWWVLAAPGALVVGFLVLARVQVARSRGRTWEHALVAAVRAEQPAVHDPASTRPGAGLDGPVGDEADNTPTVVLDPLVAADVAPEPQQVVAAAVVTADGGSLWDPLPVTLPTYVGKSRATRSVRTIDLGSPGAWTSGRLTAEEAQEAREAAVEPAGAVAPTPGGERARAVGD